MNKSLALSNLKNYKEAGKSGPPLISSMGLVHTKQHRLDSS